MIGTWCGAGVDACVQSDRLSLEKVPLVLAYLEKNNDTVHCSLGASAVFLMALRIVGPFSFTLSRRMALGYRHLTLRVD